MESLFSLARIAMSCEWFIQFKKIRSLFEALYLISTQFDDPGGPVLASREDWVHLTRSSSPFAASETSDSIRGV